MREIKFRFFPVKGCIYPHGGVMRYSDNFTSVDLLEGEHWKVMQFTGMNDRNGKPIYEGDVVKGFRCIRNRSGQSTGEERFIGVVQYDAWWGAYRRNGVKQYQGISAELMHGREMEVIGNIYENPELTDKGEGE